MLSYSKILDLHCCFVIPLLKEVQLRKTLIYYIALDANYSKISVVSGACFLYFKKNQTKVLGLMSYHFKSTLIFVGLVSYHIFPNSEDD